MAVEWFQSTFNNLLSNNKAPSYRGSELRRQSTVDKSLRPALNPQHSMVRSRGLINKPGENNCFLNSAVQILWHNDIFRRSFRQFEGHTCDGEPCIFCALKVLFTQFQHGGQVAALPPDALRVAMSNCYENLNRFQLGLMDDAAECFEKILEQIHYNLTGSNNMDSCSTPWCVSHEKFSMSTVEQTVCSCRAQSEPLPYVEFVHYVTTSQLIKHSKGKQGRNSFDSAVNGAGAYVDGLTCQNYPKCTKIPYTRRALLNSPDNICIGFIWDSDAPPLSFIMDVVESIDTKIRPSNLFHKVASDGMKGGCVFTLTALITYYGRHYSTYCYHTHRQEWIYFDDAKFRKVGKDWSNVVEECRKSRFQPLLLVYSNPRGSAIDATNAPKVVTTTTSVGSNKATPSPPPPRPSTQQEKPTQPPDQEQKQQEIPPGPSYVNVPPKGDPDATSSSKYADVRRGVDLPVINPTRRQPIDDHTHTNNQSTSITGSAGYTTVAFQQNKTEEYDDIVSSQTRPKIQKQDKQDSEDKDLIEFSISPSTIISSTPSAQANTSGTVKPSGIVNNPFMVKDSKQGQPHGSGASSQSRWTSSTTQTKQYQHQQQQPPARTSSGSKPTSQPTQQQHWTTPIENKHPQHGGSNSNRASYPQHDGTNASSYPQHGGSGMSTSPQREGTNVSNTSTSPQRVSSYNPSSYPQRDSNNTTQQNNKSSELPTTSVYKLESSVRALPKNIRDSLCHGGLCLRRVSQTSNDPVMRAILLNAALTHIHSVLNHPSVTACSELHNYLSAKVTALRTKASQLAPELDKARSDPLSLREVLLMEFEPTHTHQTRQYVNTLATGTTPNTTSVTTPRASGLLQQCIECNNRRFCDEHLLCGPCRLKLKISTQ